MTHEQERLDVSVMLKEFLNLQSEIRMQFAKQRALTDKQDKLRKQLRSIKNINDRHVNYMAVSVVQSHLRPKNFSRPLIDEMEKLKKTAQRMETIVGQLTADQANANKAG